MARRRRGDPSPIVVKRCSVRTDDDARADLVGEGLTLGVPGRPQPAEVASEAVQEVRETADEGHADAEGLPVDLPHQTDADGLLAERLAGAALPDQLPDRDAEDGEVTDERQGPHLGARSDGDDDVGDHEHEHVDQQAEEALAPVRVRGLRAVARLLRVAVGGGRDLRRLRVAVARLLGVSLLRRYAGGSLLRVAVTGLLLRRLLGVAVAGLLRLLLGVLGVLRLLVRVVGRAETHGDPPWAKLGTMRTARRNVMV